MTPKINLLFSFIILSADISRKTYIGIVSEHMLYIYFISTAIITILLTLYDYWTHYALIKSGSIWQTSLSCMLGKFVFFIASLPL